MSLKAATLVDLIRNDHKKVIDSNDRDYTYFHPSEFHECVRKLAYKFYEVEGKNTITPDLQRIFDNGHYMHDRYVQYFRNIGIIYGVWVCANPLCSHKIGEDEDIGIKEPEEPCEKCGCDKYFYHEVNVNNKEHWFSGHVDCIFKLSGDFSLVDFKSMNSRMFGQLREPLEKHVIQITIYLWILDMKSGFLLYENKDTQKMKLYEVERNAELVEQIKKRAMGLKKILQQKKLPKRPFKKDSKQCKSCQFKKVCWKNS
jgi:CRISPR/Cas system-associated exonuclease Cas4 (RecB family)